MENKLYKNSHDHKEFCRILLNKYLQQGKDEYQLGNTKVFLRSGKQAILELERTKLLDQCALVIQKNVKGYLIKNIYNEMKTAVVIIQSFARSIIAKRELLSLKRHAAAISIQKNTRYLIIITMTITITINITIILLFVYKRILGI